MKPKICPDCGAYLDPNEICDCAIEIEVEDEKREPPTADRKRRDCKVNSGDRLQQDNNISDGDLSRENELIVVEQLPVIIERFKLVSEQIKSKVDTALSLACNEETVKEVKSFRAELNKDFAEIDKRRKEVKAAVLAPYDEFERSYKELVSNQYSSADTLLKERISEVECSIKGAKVVEIKAFYDEYAESLKIDFTAFERARLNITLTASVKSLKEQAAAFLDRIAADLALIDTQEYKAEILVEYKQTLNCSAAITNTLNRHKAVEVESARLAGNVAALEVEQKAIEKVEALAPPKEVEPEITVAFKVTATRTMLKELKEFLNERGFKYE